MLGEEFLVDEIDAEEVEDQTAKDVIRECSEDDMSAWVNSEKARHRSG